MAYFVIGGDVSEGQEQCRVVGKAQRQLPQAHDDEMRDVGSGSKPFTQGLGFSCRMWGTALASKHLGTKSSMDHTIAAPFQPHTAPIHPLQQWNRSVILSPLPPGASIVPTFPACAQTVATTWTPAVMFWHHQSPLPACTHCLSSGLTAHAELKQKGRKRAQSSIAHCPHAIVPQGLTTFLPLIAGFKII